MHRARLILAISLTYCGIVNPALTAQTAEVTTKESAATFKSGVNLVPVPVVVRDGKGRAIGDLSIGDFQLFDNGKPQMISKFSVETLSRPATTTAPVSSPAAQSPTPPSGETLTNATAAGAPDHFVAYLFDDLHMTMPDLVYTRDAARRRIDSSTDSLERVAIYTASGEQTQEFTSDKDKLHAALAGIGTGHAAANRTMQQNECPPMSYYMGYQIYEKSDPQARSVATADATRCSNGAPPDMIKTLVDRAAQRATVDGDRETESSLNAVRAVVARLAAAPGRRTLVLISPGFFLSDDRRDEQTSLIERAIRANVVIGALDSRGLYTNPIFDASVANVNPATIAQKSIFTTTEAMVQADVMATLADGTGGNFYHGTNDYDEGIARTAEAPDFLYILGFSPLELKLDGKYHNLKVVLKDRKGLDLQSRKGYYAPKYGADPAEQAKQQIEEAFFSRDELHDLPAVLQTQYFKAQNGDVTLSTVAKIDARLLTFRKDAGRNRNEVTVVTGLFDNDGNYMSGTQKIVEMRLLDDTLEKRLNSGISIKNSFAVHPGRYLVRMVVRDSEGQTMAAQSGVVDIP